MISSWISAELDYADGMVFVVLAIIIVWKPLKRTRFFRAYEVDLVSDVQDINDYTEDFALREEAGGPQNRFQKAMGKVW